MDVPEYILITSNDSFSKFEDKNNLISFKKNKNLSMNSKLISFDTFLNIENSDFKMNCCFEKIMNENHDLKKQENIKIYNSNNIYNTPQKNLKKNLINENKSNKKKQFLTKLKQSPLKIQSPFGIIDNRPLFYVRKVIDNNNNCKYNLIYFSIRCKKKK